MMSHHILYHLLSIIGNLLLVSIVLAGSNSAVQAFLSIPCSPSSTSMIRTTSQPIPLPLEVQVALGATTSSTSRRSFFSESTTAVGGGVVVGELISTLSVVVGLGRSEPAFATTTSSASQSQSSLLVNRLENNVLEPPTYGMEGTDIFYPKWFAGNWKTASTTKSVEAPCGIALFGGNTTYTNGEQDIGNVLNYDSRFLTNTDTDDTTVIADREFNVKSIVKVTMGENSIVDVSKATPNLFCCLLALKNSSSLLQVDLIALNRRSEKEVATPNQFVCSEVVREIAKTVNNNNNSNNNEDDARQPQQKRKNTPSVLKEIETTSMYTYFPNTDEVHCLQRSAAFLLPSNENEMAMRMWQLSRGRAIDVRYYDVIYTRASASVVATAAAGGIS